ncbi:nucleoside deaminase [Streptomyces sp. NPDC057939]|uniref:nucleoside deaminase n=1 Tax=Streptomyces sp. NPDC057939 TaxID=3346284 RepID=UPI0036E8BA90
MTNTGGEFETAWHAAPEAVRRVLSRAYEALTAGGLAVGAVLTDPAGTVLAEGRNEAYEEPGTGGPGTGPLRGTPLAHAEMNALGAARTGWNLDATTLWSTQEPCAMCAAAARFCGVGAVRHLAPDPWALATVPAGSSPGSPDSPVSSGSGDFVDFGAAPAAGTLWLLAANVMFLRSVVAAATGPGEPEILRHHRGAEPETAALHDTVPPGLPRNDPVEEWLTRLWPALTEAARNREGRLGRPR